MVLQSYWQTRRMRRKTKKKQRKVPNIQHPYEIQQKEKSRKREEAKKSTEKIEKARQETRRTMEMKRQTENKMKVSSNHCCWRMKKLWQLLRPMLALKPLGALFSNKQLKHQVS